jgi:glycosyltransferase involved in cell wall biosynthesis
MKVSIVIRCYNEKDTIEKIVEAVRNAPTNNKEIIVVDECSQDGTQTLLREGFQRWSIRLWSFRISVALGGLCRRPALIVRARAIKVLRRRSDRTYQERSGSAARTSFALSSLNETT